MTEQSTTLQRTITTVGDRYVVTEVDGRQIAACRTLEAAERMRDQQANEVDRLQADRAERAAGDAAREAAAWTKHNAVLPRLRKVVSREPGFAVARLGERCEAVYDFWGAPVRTVVVLMAEGADLSHTYPLDDDDRQFLEAGVRERSAI